MPQKRTQGSYKRSPRFGNDIAAVLVLGPRRLALVNQFPVDDEPRAVKMIFSPSVSVLSLSEMTVEELDLFERYVTLAIATARPICVEFDGEADEARASGDESFKRLYRARPIYHEMKVDRAPSVSDG